MIDTLPLAVDTESENPPSPYRPDSLLLDASLTVRGTWLEMDPEVVLMSTS
jgi:hypothetical protein